MLATNVLGISFAKNSVYFNIDKWYAKLAHLAKLNIITYLS